MRALTDREWTMLVSRQPGTMFVAVLTTGIFCRQGCPARTPNRENVRVLDGQDPRIEASQLGFRPCLKCRPLGGEPKVDTVVKVARAIQSDPSAVWAIEDLCAVAEVGERALRRYFSQVLGISPKAFRDAVRLRRFKSALTDGDTVTDATYMAGYTGPAQRHEAAKALGMTPSAYQRGGKNMEIKLALVQTALGPMALGMTERGLCYLRFFDEGGRDAVIDDLSKEFPNAMISDAGDDAPTAEIVRAMGAFLKDGGRRPDVPVDLYGTAFQVRVWEALQAIPQGETRTYGQLAEEIGHPGAARAVGSANAKNRVAVIVPCHLVVATGGKLGGYAGGLDRKRKLLALEAAE